MLLAEGGAAGGHGGVHACQMHRHHIGVPFDDHDLTFLHDLRLGQVDAVEHLVLVVELGVGRVDVFRGDRIVVVELAGAEPEGTARRVANGPCGSSAEVIVYAPGSLAREPGVEHLLLGEALVGQMTHQVVPALRRIPTAEPRAVLLREIAAGEQLAGGQRLLGENLAHEELLGLLVRLKKTCALGAPMRVVRTAGVLVMQLDMVLVGKQFHRLAEVYVLLLLHEPEHITATTAAEAMP